MTKEFDPQDALDFIDMSAMSSWIATKDRNKESKKQGKEFDPSREEKLNNILNLFYEKSYKEGFTKYVEWLHEDKMRIQQEDIDLLKVYAKYLELDPTTLDDLMSYEEALEKGLLRWPSAAIDNQE